MSTPRKRIPLSATVWCALSAVALAAPVAVQAADPSAQQQQRQQNRPRSVERDLNHEAAKADAFFNLLAPSHVRVLVSRTPQGIHLRGSQAEIDALTDFSGLLTRHQGENLAADEGELKRLRESWNTTETYALGPPSADALYTLLAFSDVPVFVSHAQNGLTVEATKTDQAIIDKVVRILRGESLDKPQPPARRPDRPRRERPARRNQDPTQRKVAALENRVDQLEARLAALETDLRDLRAQNDQADANKQVEKPRPQRKPSPADLIDRRYKLPPQHADHLYALFAPADVTDVVVAREGNQLKITATSRDHKTIAQLVNILTRASKARAEANSKPADPNG